MRFFSSLTVFLIALFLFVGSTSVSAEEDIFFVSSEKELTDAVEQKDTLKGLAISVNFYRSTTAENQGKIDELVKYVISLESRPVFLYGQPLDEELAQPLLDKKNGFGCKPLVFAGIFPLKDGSMCGADDKPRTEAKFREWISDHWKDAKKLFFRNE